MKFINKTAIMKLKNSLMEQYKGNTNKLVESVYNKKNNEVKVIEESMGKLQETLKEEVRKSKSKDVKIKNLKEKASKTLKEFKVMRKENEVMKNKTYLFETLFDEDLSENKRISIMETMENKFNLDFLEFKKQLRETLREEKSIVIKERKSPIKNIENPNRKVYDKDEREVMSLVENVNQFMTEIY